MSGEGPNRTRSLPGALLIALVIAAGAGCNIIGFSSTDEPTTARVLATSSGALPAELVTSTNFVVDASGGIQQIASADTFFVETTFDQAFDLPTPVRFLAELTNLESGNTVSMRVFLDEEERYNSQRVLEEGETLRFLFTSTDFSPD